MSKNFERLIYDKLYTFLISNNLLTDKNSGFRSGDGTLYQLLAMSHELHEALDNGHDMRIVFMNMSKAFDKVWHKGVIFKLKRKEIDGLLLKWFISYLENRFQRVVIDGQSSNELPVQIGVPQGSILGSLDFLIYMDDIIDKILCDIRLFADDTCLLEIVHNAIESARRLNSDLKTLHMWSIQWLMLFNFIKTVILTIS